MIVKGAEFQAGDLRKTLRRFRDANNLAAYIPENSYVLILETEQMEVTDWWWCITCLYEDKLFQVMINDNFESFSEPLGEE